MLLIDPDLIITGDFNIQEQDMQEFTYCTFRDLKLKYSLSGLHVRFLKNLDGHCDQLLINSLL